MSWATPTTSPPSCPATNDDALAQGILIRPELAGEGLVHDQSFGRLSVVGVGESPSAAQRHTHRLEPQWADSFDIDERTLLQRNVGLALGQHRRDALRAERSGRGDSVALNAGNLATRRNISSKKFVC